MMAKDKIRLAAIQVGVRLEPGQRFGFHNFRHSLATFLINKGKDVKTIQGPLRHAKASTTLDLYSQPIDAAKLEAQEDIALAITSTAVAVDENLFQKFVLAVCQASAQLPVSSSLSPHKTALLDYGSNPSRVVNVLDRVGFEKHKICNFPDLNRPK